MATCLNVCSCQFDRLPIQGVLGEEARGMSMKLKKNQNACDDDAFLICFNEKGSRIRLGEKNHENAIRGEDGCLKMEVWSTI